MKKKSLLLLVFCICISILIPRVFAATEITSKLKPDKSTVLPGQTVTITLEINPKSMENGLAVLDGYIEYDSNVFDQITFKRHDEGWNKAIYSGSDKHFVVDTEQADDGSDLLYFNEATNVLDIQLTVASSAKAGNTTFKVTDLTTADGKNIEDTKDISISGDSITINVGSSATPTPTPSSSGTTPTPTPTPSSSGTTPTPTPTPSSSGTTPTPTPTPSNSGTTPTPSPSSSGTTPTPTPTPSSSSTTPTPTPTPDKSTETKENEKNNDTTNKVIPYAGAGAFLIPLIVLTSIIGVIMFVKYKNINV